MPLPTDNRFGPTGELASALGDLGTTVAPPSLLPAVMVATGLADGYAPVATPLGPALIAFTDQGLSALAIGRAPDDFEVEHRQRTGRAAHPVLTLPAPLRRAVEDRLSGERGGQPLRFDLRGLSPFESAVLRKALEIPAGEVRPYGWIAREIARPGAVRAVGTALGHNPIPLLIPCHRVVRSDGQIGNYAFGAEAKRRLLTAEGLDPADLERRADRGERFHGSDTTHIFCFPTCRHARRATTAHRVVFESAAAAAVAGYRPCRVCRPA